MTTIRKRSPAVSRRRNVYQTSSWYLSEQFWDALQLEDCDFVDKFNPFIGHVGNDIPGINTNRIVDEMECQKVDDPPSLSRIHSGLSIGDTNDSSCSTADQDGTAGLLCSSSIDLDDTSASSTPTCTPRTTSTSEDTSLMTSDSLTLTRSSFLPRLRCDPHISSPTSILDLAANFLDDLVLLNRTPISPTIWDEAEVGIVESEVFINVIEDGKRTTPTDSRELQKCEPRETLDISPASMSGLLTGNCGFQSSMTVDGPAETAQEVDALCWMSWERQLTNLQSSWWY